MILKLFILNDFNGAIGPDYALSQSRSNNSGNFESLFLNVLLECVCEWMYAGDLSWERSSLEIGYSTLLQIFLGIEIS